MVLCLFIMVEKRCEHASDIVEGMAKIIIARNRGSIPLDRMTSVYEKYDPNAFGENATAYEFAN